MPRDVDVDVNVKDKTGPGLDSVEKRFRSSGKKIEKEYEKFGTSTGNAIIKGVGAVSPKLAKKLADGLGDGAKLGAPLLISGITAALPVLSGLIGAAVTGGAAGAGILGGVALAARDSRVKEAGNTLASNLLANLSTQASPFIQPVLGVIDQVGERFSKNGDKIERIFANSAKFVEPLGDALLDVGDNLINGLDTAIGRAGPVMEALNNGFRAIGDSIEGFIDNVTANAEGNAVILDQAFKGVAGTITILGQVLGGVTYIFEQFNSIMPLSLLGQLNDLFNDTEEVVPKVTLGLKENAAGMQVLGDAQEVAAKDLALYNKALQDNAAAAEAAASAQRSLFDDLTKVGEAEDNATAAAKKNGRTLSENTAKGRANRQSLSSLASAMNGYRTNLEKAGRSTSTVNGVLNTQRNRLIATAQSMGATKSQARALADQLLGIKPRSVSVKVNGTAAAASNARNVRQEIELVRSKSVTVTVNVNASRLAAVERRLARVGAGNAAANDSFGVNAPGQSARTGGAQKVEVQSAVSVNLDGRPFRDMTAKQIRDDRRRELFRNRVGKR